MTLSTARHHVSPRRTRAMVLAWLTAAALLGAERAAGQTANDAFYITNGTVNAQALAGNTLYIGGSFSAIGPATGGGIPIDSTSGVALAGFPRVNGQVNAVIPDGAGGWFIGGAFSSVGGIARSNLARVLADNSVSAWDPQANNAVSALAAAGGVLYVGGNFTNVGGQSRNRIAAIDTATALATAFDPNANGQVLALKETGGTLYAGGAFTNVGGAGRNRIAALDETSGAAISGWNPNANNTVSALELGAGTIYAAGTFTNIGGSGRNRIAALDSVSGNAISAWNPNANNTVSVLATDGTLIYAGGNFTSIGGQTRTRIAALDASGNATAWNPVANVQVLALALSGSTVYAGGDFTNIGGQPRNEIAALDAASGAATPWNPGAYATVSALATSGAVVYAGGTFNGMGGIARNNIAAIDVTTGAATAWDANANNQVLALVTDGTRVYAAGDFTGIGGQTRNHIAALDAGSALATAWDANANGEVASLLLSGGTLYAGGTFGSIGGQVRNNIAALSTTSGAATSWDANANAQVVAFAQSGSVIYAGGDFTSIGGQTRSRIAALDATTGLATSWNTSSNGTVRALVAACGVVYAGGFFTTIGGKTRNAVAALDPGTAQATAWNPNSNGPVFGLALGSGSVYVSGVLNTVGGQTRNRIASIDATSGLATGWNPNASGTVRGVLLGGGTLYAAGGYLSIGGLAHANIAALTPDNSVTCPTISLAPVSPPSGRAGTPYSQIVTASGGVAPDCFSVTAGALPAGLSLNATTGEIAGTPSAAGTFNFSVTATEATGCTGSIAYSLLVLPACPAITILPATLAGGVVGIGYNHTLTTSAGTAPFVFSVTAGALPAGVALAGTGVFSGAPTASGTFNFTVMVTDANACTASRPCAIVIAPACPAIAVQPASVPDGSLGTVYAQTFTASAGTAPITWSVGSGALPAGLNLDANSGALSGTPTVAGTSVFSIGTTDANGCTGSHSYTITIFATPPQSFVAANVAGLCVSSAHPCVSVPIQFARGDTAGARAVSVTFQLDPTKLSLCTPLTPSSSIHAGTWLTGYDATIFQVVDNGGGSYTVDQAILGSPCGVTSGGLLFTVDVHAVGTDGTGAITVTAVKARDCDSAPIGALPGAPALLTIQNAAPAAITDLAASRVPSGNGALSTMGISLSWATGGGGNVALYRAPFGAYPEYGDDAPAAAPNPTLAPGAPWTLVTAAAASGFVDSAAPRGFWYYVARITDPCGNVSQISNLTPGTLNYMLGDVSDGLTAGTGDNRVGAEDISLLGAFYGADDAAITANHVEYLDVGPTVDLQPTSRPTPDDQIDFEDLMIFASNFGSSVAAPQFAARGASVASHGAPLVVGAAPAFTAPIVRAGAGARTAATRGALPSAAASFEAFALDAPSSVEPGADAQAVLHVSAGGRMQGFSAQLAWDADVVQPTTVHSSQFVEGQGGVLLSARPGNVDAALLGVRDQGFSGEAAVATVTFRVLRAGDPGIRLAKISARDASNHAVDVQTLADASVPAHPSLTVLLAPAPNPFAGGTTLSFALAKAGPVELAIYGVDGRRIRTLVREDRDAGNYEIAWDGRDESRAPVRPGVFYVRLVAGGRQFTKRLVALQ
jgi:trimeric autotransporter adhesin